MNDILSYETVHIKGKNNNEENLLSTLYNWLYIIKIIITITKANRPQRYFYRIRGITQ